MWDLNSVECGVSSIPRDHLKSGHSFAPLSTSSTVTITGACVGMYHEESSYDVILGNKKEETTMYDKAYEQNRYLRQRLSSINTSKETALLQEFGLKDEDRPEDMKEFFDRIATGRYILPEKPENQNVYEMHYSIRWRDPSLKEDSEGYKAAAKNLVKQYQSVKDIIEIGEAADALKAVQEFENTPTSTYH